VAWGKGRQGADHARQDKLVVTNNPALQNALDGARDSLPLVLAAVPFGILYGALAQASGLSLFTSMAMSLIVFAGSSQFVAVSLLLTATPILVVILATFFINLRHLMYSAHLTQHVRHLSSPLRALLAFWLTDETFATVANKVSGSFEPKLLHYYYLGSAVFMYSNWQLCSYIGYEIGLQLSDPLSWGLDIALVVAFIGVITPALVNKAMWLCAIAASVSALITHAWPYQSGLIFSMLLGICVGVLASYKGATRA
jgi:4-azaleucine resistance transporter AzlC